MKKKLELDDVDVVFDPTPLTEEEKRLISEFIQKDKAKRRNKHYAQQRVGASLAEVRLSR